ncbi:MAG: hypothetical protein R3B09_27390 [Nannocystaceae bacterium]
MRERPWQAVIDIGSNSVLLLLARPRDEGPALEVADDRCIITRLGEGVARSGVLKPEAIERTLAALRTFRELADERGAAIRAVTTEGVRLAGNQADFLGPAAAIVGGPVRVLSGDEEARFSYLSVAAETDGGGRPLRVVDIGGASTELVVGRGPTVIHAVSHPIGSVKLTERFVDHDPPTPASLEAMAAHVAEVLATQPLPPQPRLHGLAGTITTAAALLLDLPRYDRDQVDGTEHPRGAIEALRDRLAAIPTAERVGPLLPVGRADVFVSGLTILLGVMDHCGAETLVVRDRGHRYALIDRS